MSAAYPWGFADESMGLSGGQWTFIIECMRNDRITPSQFQKMMKNYAITRAFVKMYEQNETLSTQQQSDEMERLFPAEVDRIMDDNFLHDVPGILDTPQFLSVTHEGLLDPGQSRKGKLGDILLMWKEGTCREMNKMRPIWIREVQRKIRYAAS